MRHFLLTLTLCLTALLPAFAVQPGDQAPAIALPSAAGATVNLSDFAGKTVVLEWINFGCPFVKKFYSEGHMPAFQKSALADDVAWLSICSSAEGKQGYYAGADLTKTITKNGWAGTAYLIDSDGSVGKAYAAKTTPHMYIVNVDDQGQGTVVYAGAIDSVRSTKSKDIAGATNYVTTALGELAARKSISMSASKAYGCSVKYAK
jgi:glutathione peroxidase-family protein